VAEASLEAAPAVREQDGLPPSDPLLSVRSLSVRFGGLAALDDVSLEAAPGEIVGVIGPNGAGKTTLFNVMCGFVRPDSGSIVFDGRRLGTVRPHQLSSLGIGRTLQSVGLWPSLTVAENVMTGLHRESRGDIVSALLGLPRSSRDEARLRQRAVAALDEVGAADFAGRYPSSLPYPIQKKVALARALVSEPRLLLLDEPASGLSEADIDLLADMVLRLRHHRAVVLVEHHMDLVMGVCDRLEVLDFGRVIASGSPSSVKSNPLVTAAYLGEEVPEDGAGGRAAPGGGGGDVVAENVPGQQTGGKGLY
jgi:branched-chain amino acid transport system ATP-binding protein